MITNEKLCLYASFIAINGYFSGSNMVPWLNQTTPIDFPAHSSALDEPDGLLAAGGDLSLERLLSAYKLGIFPWYNPGEPILWWTPSQRMVIYSETIHISRSMKRFLKYPPFEFRINTAFTEVMQACSQPRTNESGTWIDDNMIKAYTQLHKHGHASSVECWQDNNLVGGVYGVHLGAVFFGESMFSKVSNASKAALIFATQHLGIELIDCQFHTEHLASMGGKLIHREKFLQEIKRYIDSPKNIANIEI